MAVPADPADSGDQTEACIALVHKLAEPLTAIANYLEAAARLHRADSSSARSRIAELVEKSGRESARANEILRQMRDLLRRDPKIGDSGGDRSD